MASRGCDHVFNMFNSDSICERTVQESLTGKFLACSEMDPEENEFRAEGTMCFPLTAAPSVYCAEGTKESPLEPFLAESSINLAAESCLNENGECN